MMRLTKLVLFGWFFLAGINAYTQQSAPDSTRVEWRKADDKVSERLADDDELNYPLEIAEDSGGLFQKIMAALAIIFMAIQDFLFGSSTNDANLINILLLLMTIILVYLLIRLFYSRYNWIFGGKRDRQVGEYVIENENIHDIDYDAEIEKAVNAGGFRIAVRLVYLKTLKLLSDREVIHWAEGKTNREYQFEVQKSGYKNEFLQLSYHFNYIWYGHFEASKQSWELAEDEFRKIKQQTKSQTD